MFGKKKKRKAPSPVRAYCAAVVPAAGMATRMGGVNKLSAELCGAPVLAHSLVALQQSELIDEIVIAARGDEIAEVYDICKAYQITKATRVVRGGDSRLHSVLLALGEVSAQTRLVAVHDGARPLVRVADIDAVISKAAIYGAAILAVPVKDTLKEAADGLVKHTPMRARFYHVQTPQVFDKNVLHGALTKAAAQNLDSTDDSSAVERLGVPVHVVLGHTDNIKITTPDDLIVAAALLEARNEDRAGV